MKVLVVDDSRTVRFILVSILRDLGVLDIEEAENGKVAWDMCRARDYDVVLSDIHMPEMNGLDFLGALRNSMKPRLREQPVIIISSETASQCIEKARDLGASGYIKKPFDPQGISQALGAAVPSKFPNARRKVVSQVVEVSRPSGHKGVPHYESVVISKIA